ncbi:MAG: ComEA family DNA-binding protein [Kiritimatiellia bacterium]
MRKYLRHRRLLVNQGISSIVFGSNDMNKDRHTVDEDLMDDEIIKGDPFQIIRDIQHILANDPEERIISDDSFEFPLHEALNLMPDRYRKNVAPEDVLGESVFLSLEHVFEQLTHGKVQMPVSRLAFFIPLHLIYRAALDDHASLELPLKQVVKAVGLEELKKRTPVRLRMYDVTGFDDPFIEGDTLSSQQATGLIIDDTDQSSTSEAFPIVLEDEPANTELPTTPEDATEDRGEEELRQPADAEIPDQSAKPVSEPEPTVLPKVPTEDKTDAEPNESTVTIKQEVPATILYPLMGIRNAKSGEPICNLDESEENETAPLHIPDLMNQLRKGVVSVSMATLKTSIPDGRLTDEAELDANATVILDLKKIVEGVGIEALKAATPAAIKFYDIEWMADPFVEPSEKPDLQAVRIIRQEKPRDDSAAAGESQADIQAPRITVYDPASDMQPELDYYELPGNININVATASELMLLAGVDTALANAIVTYRTEHGTFASVFDLFKVKGIDGIVFRQMTGMKAEHKHRHRRRTLASLLKIPAGQVAGLTAVADAIARKAAFSGCLIADMDGLLLASTGMETTCRDLSAILPVSLNQISHNMQLADLKLTGMVSFTIDGVLYSAHKTGKVILAVAHKKNMIDESDLFFIRKVGRELRWLLSIRAYAGPSA